MLTPPGALTLALWAAIQHFRGLCNTFDFEGSMIREVEKYFMSFSAVQTPVLSVSKINSKSLMLAHSARDVLGALQA